MLSSATVNGKRREERLLPGSELGARPGDGGKGVAVERVVRTSDRRRVVVAEHDDGAARGIPLDQLDHGHRVGPVADMVAEKRIAVRAQCIRMRETRGDGLEIAVDVGEQGELQTGPVFCMRYPRPRVVTISTPAASSFLRRRCT
jgi:hypothetical protein